MNQARTVTLKLNDNQYRWLCNAALCLERETGCDVTTASLLLALVDFGMPRFEAELNQLKAEAQKVRPQKRFAALQLAL